MSVGRGVPGDFNHEKRKEGREERRHTRCHRPQTKEKETENFGRRKRYRLRQRKRKKGGLRERQPRQFLRRQKIGKGKRGEEKTPPPPPRAESDRHVMQPEGEKKRGPNLFLYIKRFTGKGKKEGSSTTLRGKRPAGRPAGQ